MVLSIMLVIQGDLILRGMQALGLGIVAWVVQPRLRLRRTIIFLVATVAFNLLTPSGKVLLRLGQISITEGALMIGLGKAVSLGGLLFLSRLMVDLRLRIPGRLGELITLTMTFLTRLMDDRVHFRLRSPIVSLDQALLAAKIDQDEQVKEKNSGKTTVAGAAWVVAIMVICGFAVTWGQIRG